jgi:hypothetical protein
VKLGTTQVDPSSPSQEVEVLFDSMKLGPVNRLRILPVRYGGCRLVDLGFAFEATVDEAGEGIKEAEAVEGTVLHGFFEAFGTEIDDGLADLGDSDFGGSLVAGKAFGAAGEVECEFVAKFAFLKALLVSKPVAIAAKFFPSGDMLGSEGQEIFDFGFWIFD